MYRRWAMQHPAIATMPHSDLAAISGVSYFFMRWVARCCLVRVSSWTDPPGSLHLYPALLHRSVGPACLAPCMWRLLVLAGVATVSWPPQKQGCPLRHDDSPTRHVLNKSWGHGLVHHMWTITETAIDRKWRGRCWVIHLHVL